uniref:Nucleic acid-binding protein n=1 Tax=Rhabditophanes sp. KR3021 TaxID=114890 RepID=A0AC35TI34_9BILA
MPSINKTLVNTSILLGKIVNLSKIGLKQTACVQVRCQQNEFNDFIKKYHAKSYDYWALDKLNNLKVGDMVLIKELGKDSEKPSTNVGHQVTEVVFKFGSIIDPVTGKRVIENRFVDEIALEKKIVKEVVEEPQEETSLLFEDVRDLQRQKLAASHATQST